MPNDLLSLYIHSLHIDPCSSAYCEQPAEEFSGEYCPEFSSIGYIVQGELHLTAAGESFTARSGDLYLLPARSTQQYHVPLHPPGEPHKKYFCHFYALTGGRDLFELIDLPRCVPVPPKQRNQVRKLMDTICRMQSNPKLLAPMRLKSLLLDLVRLYISLAGEKNITPHTDQQNSSLSDVLALIDARLDQPFSIHDLAVEMHLSENHFIRLFRERIGVTPGKYILRRRLRRASDLLLQTTLPIAEIAGRTGFENAFYFSNVFKKAYGLSPSAFRGSGGLYYSHK